MNKFNLSKSLNPKWLATKERFQNSECCYCRVFWNEIKRAEFYSCLFKYTIVGHISHLPINIFICISHSLQDPCPFLFLPGCRIQITSSCTCSKVSFKQLNTWVLLCFIQTVKYVGFTVFLIYFFQYLDSQFVASFFTIRRLNVFKKDNLNSCV
jgi:hypothetical protein